MAAFIKAINAKIRSNPAVSYVCSTRKFWGFFISFFWFCYVGFSGGGLDVRKGLGEGKTTRCIGNEGFAGGEFGVRAEGEGEGRYLQVQGNLRAQG